MIPAQTATLTEQTPYHRMAHVWLLLTEHHRQKICELARVGTGHAGVHWYAVPVSDARLILEQMRMFGAFCHMIHDDDTAQQRAETFQQTQGTGTHG